MLTKQGSRVNREGRSGSHQFTPVFAVWLGDDTTLDGMNSCVLNF